MLLRDGARWWRRAAGRRAGSAGTEIWALRVGRGGEGGRGGHGGRGASPPTCKDGVSTSASSAGGASARRHAERTLQISGLPSVLSVAVSPLSKRSLPYFRRFCKVFQNFVATPRPLRATPGCSIATRGRYPKKNLPTLSSLPLLRRHGRPASPAVVSRAARHATGKAALRRRCCGRRPPGGSCHGAVVERRVRRRAAANVGRHG